MKLFQWIAFLKLRAKAILALYFFLVMTPAYGIDLSKLENDAKTKYIEHFTEFTLDKNVMGPGFNPAGKRVREGVKRIFDPGTGGWLPFQSDLTFHFKVYKDKVNTDPNKPPEDLSEFVSEHGAISKAQGSSRMERDIYAFEEKYRKDAQKNQNQPPPPPKKGFKEDGVFVIETKEIEDEPATAGQPAKKIEVSRTVLKNEVSDASKKVADDSTETVFAAGRDKEFANDKKTFLNTTFLRQGAFAASVALWNDQLRNLGQRRAFDAANAPLSIDIPSAEQFAAQEKAKAAKITDPQAKQRAEKRIDEQKEKIQAISALNYKEINPEYKPDQNGKEKLEKGNLKTENGIQRDSRVTLLLNEKAGTDISKIPSNWQYTKKDESFTMNTYDENGNVTGETTKTNRDQIKNFNSQLVEAKKGYDEVSTRLNTKFGDPTQFAKTPGKDSVRDLNRPTQYEMDEFQLPKSDVIAEKAAETYDQLLKDDEQ